MAFNYESIGELKRRIQTLEGIPEIH